MGTVRFFIAEDLEPRASHAMRQLVTRLASSRRWTIGPPEYVDEEEAPEGPHDPALRTVGGTLRLYSARGAWAAKPPPEMDRRHLEEVRAIIDALRSFSATTGHELELELNDIFLGTIAAGKPDRLIEEGFLGEWEKALQSQG